MHCHNSQLLPQTAPALRETPLCCTRQNLYLDLSPEPCYNKLKHPCLFLNILMNYLYNSKLQRFEGLVLVLYRSTQLPPYTSPNCSKNPLYFSTQSRYLGQSSEPCYSIQRPLKYVLDSPEKTPCYTKHQYALDQSQELCHNNPWIPDTFQSPPKRLLYHSKPRHHLG